MASEGSAAQGQGFGTSAPEKRDRTEPAAATPSPLTPGEQAELEEELALHGQLIVAQRALHEIADNTTRASYQHRARALLALEELERRWDQ